MKTILILSAVLATALVFLIVVKTPITPLPSDASNPNQTGYTDAGTIVEAYYQALNGRDLATAIDLLPDNVVVEFNLRNTSTRLKYNGVDNVQQWLETDHTVLSRSVSEMFVRGDTVEYTLTEWVNPRTAGANIPQPVITHWTATLYNNKILLLSQDPASD